MTNTKTAKLPISDKTLSKVSGFIIVYRLYIRIKIRGVAVKE